MAAGAPGTGSLTALALRFVICNGLDECQAFLLANPQLVSPDGLAALQALMGAADRARGDGARSIVDDRAELLARCVEIGVDAAFAERDVGDVPAPGGVRAPAALLPAADRVHRAHQAYLETREAGAADSFVEAAQALVDHPELVAAPVELRARAGGGLGEALLARYSFGHDVTDLERALGALKTAVELVDVGNPDFVDLVSNLVDASRRYSERTHDAAEVSHAVARVRDALRASHWSPDAEAELQYRLCVGLRVSAELGAGPSAAGEAADAGVAAVELTLPDSPDRPPYQYGAGNAFWVRYNQTGEMADLIHALQLLEAAAEGARDTQLELPACVLFAHAVRDRYALLHERKDLELLVRLRQRAVELSDAEDPQSADNLAYLGVALHDRYVETDRATDLAAAVEYCERAVSRCSGRLASRMVCETSLAIALRSRWHRERDPSDLDRVIELYDALLPVMPAALAAGAKSNLAGALAERAELNDDPADSRRAVDIFRQAAGGPESGNVVLFGAASRWALHAIQTDNWEEAAKASQVALGVLAELLRLQRTSAEKSAWLGRAQRLHVWAAYSLAKLGRPWDAILAIESGRSRWLAEALQLDAAELEDLVAAGRGELKQRYLQALDALSELQEVTNIAERDAARLASRRRAALAEVDEAIAAIRAVPGYGDFGRAPSRRAIQEAAAVSPLCYLAASRSGGMALILRGASADPETVWLPRLTEDELGEQSERLVTALNETGEEPDETVHAVTYWLWDAVMGPVLEKLDGAPEVCLIPSSWLSFCPLHAAATVDGSAPSGHRYAIDRLCITYAASARARGHSLELQRSAPSELNALVVADPHPTSAAPLPSARYEAHAVERRLPARILSGAEATKTSVMRHLSEHSVLHFACHGKASLMAPVHSHLLLAHDEQLLLADLLAADLDVRLAVLSACESALSGGIVDEAVALPTGLLQAGAVGSVATMWSVSDASAALLMTCFYAEWRDAGRSPAEALRAAQRWARDATNDEKVARFPECRDLLVAASASSDEPWGTRREYGHPGDWAAFALFGS